ncbi:MAG: TRZ/ATZ family protein [Ruminococcaceae bacterium]|nr:TRZ/ATZ family protein [Oscillospiraceae bacterium]
MELKLPLTKDELRALRAGDVVTLSGVIYTARDAAHKRLCAMIAAGEALPFSLQDAVLYYCGPCPAPEGAVIGSCGPTTSSRMDAYAPTLYANGASGAIGKGRISAAVKAAMREYGGVYFLATGGAGALLARCVKSAEVVAFPELGAEAVRRLVVENLPLVVGVDADGTDLYELATAGAEKETI